MKNKDRYKKRIKFKNIPIGSLFITVDPSEKYIKVSSKDIMFLNDGQIYDYSWEYALENFVMVVES